MSLRFLLDTNIVSHMLLQPHGVVALKVRDVGEEVVAVSFVVASELRFGAGKRPGPQGAFQSAGKGMGDSVPAERGISQAQPVRSGGHSTPSLAKPSRRERPTGCREPSVNPSIIRKNFPSPAFVASSGFRWQAFRRFSPSARGFFARRSFCTSQRHGRCH